MCSPRLCCVPNGPPLQKLVNMISILMPDHLSPEAAKEAIANTGLQVCTGGEDGALTSATKERPAVGQTMGGPLHVGRVTCGFLQPTTEGCTGHVV